QTASEAGQVEIDGVAVGAMGPTERRRRGLAFVPEERLGRGSVPDMSLVENTLLTGYHRGLVRHGMVRRTASRRQAEAIRKRFDVRCAGVNAQARSLSGGNLQKFIVGREMMQQPKLL